MTKSFAYIEGYNSRFNAYTGGNPYWGRPGQLDWDEGRWQGQKDAGLISLEEILEREQK